MVVRLGRGRCGGTARDGIPVEKTLYSTKESAELPYLVSAEDEAAQASYIADHVLDRREAGIVPKRQAVLFRAAHHSDLLEIELGRRNIPFVKYGGLKFLEAAHVKDVLAILRWAENPRDAVAGHCALQLQPGIGPGTASNVIERLAQAGFVATALARFTPPAAASVAWPGTFWRQVQPMLIAVTQELSIYTKFITRRSTGIALGRGRTVWLIGNRGHLLGGPLPRTRCLRSGAATSS